MLKTLLTSTVLFLALAHPASSQDGRLVGEIAQPPGHRELRACPCEFDLGKQIDGETGLVIDQNADRQPAFVSVDGSMIRLEVSNAFRYTCRPAEKVRASWKGHGIDLQLDLTVDGPGEESCWFKGSMTVTKNKRRETRRIVGACGC